MKRTGLSRVKDAALEQTLLLFLRPRFERYGEVRHLSLDTTEKRISAEVRLLGDPVPIEISDARYRIEERGESCVLTIFDVRTSKPWLQNLIEDRFPELSVPIPPYVRPLL
jgi:hypothetical protein